MEASTCVVRNVLDEVLETFPGVCGGLFDTTYAIGESRYVKVTRKSGHAVAYNGPEGLVVIHRADNGDITLNSCRSLGNVEAVSRRNGLLQGIDEIPRELRSLLRELMDAKTRSSQN